MNVDGFTNNASSIPTFLNLTLLHGPILIKYANSDQILWSVFPVFRYQIIKTSVKKMCLSFRFIFPGCQCNKEGKYMEVYKSTSMTCFWVHENVTCSYLLCFTSRSQDGAHNSLPSFFQHFWIPTSNSTSPKLYVYHRHLARLDNRKI